MHNAKKETPRLRQHRKRLKETRNNPCVSSAHPHKLKIGSINVDGLDLQTDAALRELLSDRDFDVSIIKDKKVQYVTIGRKVKKKVNSNEIKFPIMFYGLQ